MRGPHLDAAEVRAALTRDLIVQHFGLEVRGRPGGWWRGRACPACGKTWRDLAGSGFCIGMRGWTCKACGAKGDTLDLLARLEALDPRCQFASVLERAAAIAGVIATSNPAVRERRAAARARAADAERREERASARRRRDRARTLSRHVWSCLVHDHLRGRRYLETRALDVSALRARDVVRFHPFGWRRDDEPGDPAVALHDWDGAFLNIVRRRITADEPKAPNLRGAPNDGTLVGHLAQIRAGGTVVVTEGVVDTLTAILAWPHAAVLGAHGVEQLARVVAAAAPRVVAARGRLVLVPHPDRVGQDAAVEAAARALEAGLAMDRDLDVLELGARDLNEAWCAGWRP